MSRPTLHMVPAAVWARQDPAAPYLPDAYPLDGFVHCTDGDAGMVATANRFYRDDPRPFVVLTLDLDATGSPWRFDDPGERFPHVYGPIAPASVMAVRPMLRGGDGTFTGIGPPDA